MNTTCDLSQRKLSLVLSLYIGLILNSTLFINNGASGGWLEVVSAVLSAIAMVAFTYGLLSLFSVFGTTLYKLLSGFVVIASAAASYYMIFFNVVIGYGVIVSTLTLDTDLHTESVGYKFMLWLLIAGIIPALLITRIRIINSLYQRRWRGIIPFLTSIVPALGIIVIMVVSVKTIVHLTEEQAIKNNKYVASTGGIIAHSFLPTNWIAGLGIYLHQIVHEKTTATTLLNPATEFTYHSTPNMEDLYVVFVIGETTRGDHMGMLGYERNTTPLLAQEPNVIAFAGTSCDTATKLSLRCMFVREGGTENNAQRTLKERNIFAVLRKLGFTSELFAMQSEAWFYSSIDANRYEIREVIASANAHSNRPIDDMLLVSQLKKSIQTFNKGKHLVVLHTKGSHYLYSQRYTKEFAQFQPECMDIDATCSKQQLINSYDNSVLYVDYVLKNVLDEMRDKNAIVFYTSDHGESIDENNHFHATPKEIAPPEQFNVPFIVWASDTFLSTPENQMAFAELKTKKAMEFTATHTELFDSILGCIGFSSPDGGINPNNNWCATTQ